MKGTTKMSTKPTTTTAGTDSKIEAEVINEETGRRIGKMTVTKRDAIVSGVTAGAIALGMVIKFLVTKDIKVETKTVEVPVPTDVTVQ